eukprot:COSAG05_NODE_136_length_16902_cov_21.052312_2_plen_71_part_00
MDLLRQVQPEGKYVVELDKLVDMKDVKPNLRIALRNDSYALHKVGTQSCSLAIVTFCVAGRFYPAKLILL